MQEVNLSWNGLGEHGSKAIETYLAKNHTLTSLDVSHCRISFPYLGYILKGLKGNDTLNKLKVCVSFPNAPGLHCIYQCISTIYHIMLHYENLFKNVDNFPLPIDSQVSLRRKDIDTLSTLLNKTNKSIPQ